MRSFAGCHTCTYTCCLSTQQISTNTHPSSQNFMSRSERGEAQSAYQPVRTLPIRLCLAYAAGSRLRLEYETAEEHFGQHSTEPACQLPFFACDTTTTEVVRWTTLVADLLAVLSSCNHAALSLLQRAGCSRPVLSPWTTLRLSVLRNLQDGTSKTV